MKRHKHSLSHYVLSTFDMGQLIPVANYEVLPGDSVRMSSSCLLRVSPLMAPVMHPVAVRLHHWYVPFRLMWDDWEDFITGGPDGLGPGEGPPYLTIDSAWTEAALGNYLGIPTAAQGAVGHRINVWPIYAYNMIYNEFYRDQDLVTEVPLDSIEVQQCAWEKDGFTAARPWTQKGPEVTLPITGTVPVVSTGDGMPVFNVTSATGNPKVLGGSAAAGVNWNAGPGGTAGSGGSAGNATWAQTKLVADLATSVSSTVNDVRLAFALQRYQEARAQYGSRYTEYLRYLGVRSSDARLQRPEYLGGGRATISFSEVLKTGEGDTPDDTAPIGEMRGHGISAMRSRRWIRFFEEHGVVITLASIRPRTMYADGIFRAHQKTVKEDYWQKELELVGQQEVPVKEVYAGAAAPDVVFGFQDRYSEYRHHPSYVAGEFRTTMADWHLARMFGSEPALNADFVNCVPSKRIHAEQTTNTIWGMFSHSIQARRMVTNKVIGRIF